jgi:hypothetical protein
MVPFYNNHQVVIENSITNVEWNQNVLYLWKSNQGRAIAFYATLKIHLDDDYSVLPLPIAAFASKRDYNRKTLFIQQCFCKSEEILKRISSGANYVYRV